VNGIDSHRSKSSGIYVEQASQRRTTMTRKDYLKAVEHIKSALWVRNNYERKLLAVTFADFFENDNPRFNRDLFIKACDVK